MFDGLFQAETDRALGIEAESPRPGPKPKPPGMFTGMGTALIEGPAQGVLESGRALVNVLTEYGKAAAFREGGRKEDTIDRMLTEESPDAKELGRLAKKYDPDPETSSTAAQIVHQFGRLGAKIAGAAAIAGPAAPLVVGADEGITEGLKLADKGVDAATAAKAGAVHGLATAASVALPIAGRTILQTVGLAAAGGPAAFIAERATIREILEGADYGAQAAEYDPFDVTGLLASTGGPLLFGLGAHALRAGRRGSVATQTAVVPDDVVDAARTDLLNQHDLDLVRGDGPEAVQRHAEGRKVAEQRFQDGQPPVDIGDQRGAEAESGPARTVEEVGTGQEPPAAAKTQAAAQDQAGEASTPPEVRAALDLISARKDFELELDDGTRTSAMQALADAQRAVADADVEAKGFRAAIECFLEGGA